MWLSYVAIWYIWWPNLTSVALHSDENWLTLVDVCWQPVKFVRIKWARVAACLHAFKFYVLTSDVIWYLLISDCVFIDIWRSAVVTCQSASDNRKNWLPLRVTCCHLSLDYTRRCQLAGGSSHVRDDLNPNANVFGTAEPVFEDTLCWSASAGSRRGRLPCARQPPVQRWCVWRILRHIFTWSIALSFSIRVFIT